jgi:tetratricopeptide (TPR) repeat protein
MTTQTTQTLAEILEGSRKLENTGKRQEAVDFLSIEIGKANQINARYRADLFNQRGFVKRMMQKYDDAADDYAQALYCGNTNAQLASAHINMADIHRVAKEDAPAAHASLDKALENTGRWTVLEAKAYDQRGMVFDYIEKKFPEAMAQYRRAQRTCEDIMENQPDNKEAENRFGQVILHLGYCYFEINDQTLLPKAYDTLNHALQIFQKHDDRQAIMNTVTSLGRLAMHHKDYDGAIAQYDQAWKILEETQHKGGICSLALHLAEAYLVKINSDKNPDSPHDIPGKERSGEEVLVTSYLERLRDGIRAGELTTPSDAKALKDRFNHLAELYNVTSNITVENFGEVYTFFAV